MCEKADREKKIGPLRIHNKLRRRGVTQSVSYATALMAVVASVATGCSSSSSSNSGRQGSAANAAPAEVHIAGPVNSLYAPDQLILGPKYLGQVAKQFHTTFKFDVYGSSSAQVDAFLGGSDQFMMVQASSLYPAAASGKDILAINQSSVGGSQILVGAAKYQSSRGTNLAAYDGGTWCYTSVGSASYVGDQVAAQAAGLDWGKQKHLAVGSVSGFLPAVKSGRCDIAGEDSTSAASAILANAGYVVQNQSEEKVGEQIYHQSAPLVGGTFDTSQSFADKYPQLTQAIDTAFVKAELFEQYTQSDPKTIYASMPSQFTSANSLPAFTEQWKLQSPCLVVGSGLFPDASITATTNFLTSISGVSGDVSSIPSHFTNKYTLEAYKELGLPTPPSDGTALSKSQIADSASKFQ